jgi:hypothetical protein
MLLCREMSDVIGKYQILCKPLGREVRPKYSLLAACNFDKERQTNRTTDRQIDIMTERQNDRQNDRTT